MSIEAKEGSSSLDMAGRDCCMQDTVVDDEVALYDEIQSG